MTREEARQAAEVMMAYAEGKEIELNGRSSCGCQMWEETSDPTFNWYDFMYRTKTKPKYRHFKTREECWEEMMKHQPFGWVKSKDKGYFHLIGLVQFAIELEDVMITFATSENLARSSHSIYENYIFADGTPFGIKEE